MWVWLVIPLASIVLSCSSGGTSSSNSAVSINDANQLQWELTSQSTSYRIKQLNTFYSSNWMIIEVTGGSISTIEEEFSGAQLPQQDFEHYRTVEQIFADIEYHLLLEADVISVVYHELHGYPTSFKREANDDYDFEYSLELDIDQPD